MLKPLREMVGALTALETPEGKLARAGVDAIRSMFATASGQQMLGLLCMVAHPFAPRVRDNPQDTAAADGRAEVVCLLLEIGGRGAVSMPLLNQTTQCPETT